MALLGTEVNSTHDDEITDLKRLTDILTKVDASQIDAGKSVLEVLQRLFPHLDKNQLIEIDKQANLAIQERNQQLHEGSYFYLKLSLAFAATVGGIYFGGPLAVSLSNGAFNKIYSLIFGPPNINSLTYGIISPCKKGLTYIGTTYGPYVFGALAGPTTFNTASAIEYFCKKVAAFKKWLNAKPNKKYSDKSVDQLTADFVELMMTSPEPSPCADEEELSIESLTLGGVKVELYHGYRNQQRNDELRTQSEGASRVIAKLS